jgi:glycosyltransferase involved in cell wall biosynthesis
VPDFEKIGNVTIRRYRFYNRYLFTFLAFFPTFLQASNYDFIQTTSYNAALPAYFAGFLRRKKVFITFHEYWGKLWFSLPFFSKFSLWAHFLFERMLVMIPFYKFIAVSKHTFSKLISAGLSKDNVSLIYNGISYEDWKAPPGIKEAEVEVYEFIYFGRLGISKGLDILLEAAQKLSAREKEFHVTLIIPEEPQNLFNYIKNLITRFSLYQKISIVHHVPKEDLIKKISLADAVIIPSYNEGFCYTAVESVALGKPIISSHQGALPEVVSGQFLALPHLDSNNLAEAMHKAMHGHWSHSEVRHFHLADTVDQYINLYESLEDKLS